MPEEAVENHGGSLEGWGWGGLGTSAIFRESSGMLALMMLSRLRRGRLSRPLQEESFVVVVLVSQSCPTL